MSSKRRLRKQGCRGKVSYHTRAEAQRHVFDGMRVYKCPFKDRYWPSHYHVGHP